MRVLVGSKALESTGLLKRQPKDIDYFSDENIPGAEVFWHPSLTEWNWKEVATVDELYTIKISHIYWTLQNGSWAKHWYDILTLEETATFLPELHDLLYPIWEERYGKKKVNLDVEPEDFFNANIQRKYEHDSIHASVAYYDEPLFNRVLKDGHAVNVDWRKFMELSEEDQLRLVREEIYATALERYLIPFGYQEHVRTAYNKALQQTLTSYWKGKWATFIALNARALNKPELNYQELHLNNQHKLKEL